jgi:GrpB-like predicted nucleotidyltransferase (UPF0157 family)
MPAALNDAIHLEPHNPNWAVQFAEERSRILEVLGECGRGGVVWAVHHIGSTAIPDIHAKPVLDILVELYPAALEEKHIAALKELGYEYRGEAGIPGRQFFRTNPRTVHLHAFLLDTPEVHHHLLFRDYLRAHPAEAGRYETLKLTLAKQFSHNREAYTNGKHDLIQQLLERAQKWQLEEIAFQPLLRATREFEGADFEWFVSAGWALDAWMGRVTRHHHDLDILVWRDEQHALKAHLEARGWTLNVTRDGQYHPWQPGERLELPTHQIHAFRDDAMLDVMLAERGGQQWQFRRDPGITRDLTHAVVGTPPGLRALAPEIVLLFKSGTVNGQARAKDQQDFERVVSRLDAEPKAWLKAALKHHKPDHPWLERL